MKHTLITLGALSAIFIGSVNVSFAQTIDLKNGGLGQPAATPQQFGVAVCNDSAEALTSAVPIAVAVGSTNTTVPSAAPIAAGQCEYSYLTYAQFNMQAGQSYSVNVSVGNDQTVYDVTVPPQPATISLSADVSNNISYLFSNVWSWFVGLFRKL